MTKDNSIPHFSSVWCEFMNAIPVVCSEYQSLSMVYWLNQNTILKGEECPKNTNTIKAFFEMYIIIFLSKKLAFFAIPTLLIVSNISMKPNLCQEIFMKH